MTVQVGDKHSLNRTFSAEDVAEYGNLCGDKITNDQVPEPLIGALFSYLLGVKLPGPGTNYLKQETHFLSETHIGTPLVASVEVTRIRAEKSLVDLRTECVDDKGQKICTGRALVLVKDVT